MPSFSTFRRPLIVVLGAAALLVPAIGSANAATLQTCRTTSLATSTSNPIQSTEWRCDPSNSNASYETVPVWLPARDGDPKASSGFVWQALSNSDYTPYATAMWFSENTASGPMITYQLWQPLGNGTLTAPRCWHLAGDGMWVGTQPNECLAHA
jgi:hypothetical protein